MTFQERMDYLDDAHNLVDMYQTDVTHEEVDAMSDDDLRAWVDNWYEVEAEAEHGTEL